MQIKNEKILGHIAAIAAVTIWGTTFISSKILLRSFTPVEILVFRFIIGFFVLTLLRRKLPIPAPVKEELLYVMAGLTGVTAYYMLEGTALTYTLAANVGVIISTAPFFTAVVLLMLTKGQEKPYWTFFLGFVIALAGISLISLNGSALSFNPLGDFLTVLAALVWAFYSYFLKKINDLGRTTIENTQKIFFWGIIFMIPTALLLGYDPDLSLMLQPINILNILFLGVFACAICFLIWNFAVKAVGAVETSIYIYLDPVITLIASYILLHEPVTKMMLVGTALTMAGLIVSEFKPAKH